jgi:succinoglycan biosynthesis protein ExoA
VNPRVTLIVAMRNEERFIEACLASITAQDWPADDLEILVYDGQSTDRSRKIVERVAASHPNVALRDNPKRIQAAAWNSGIDTATGDVIGIVSAHCELAPDYVRTAVDTLERTQADMVGGPMRAEGDGYVARAAAVATSTSFGVGGAKFHYASEEGPVDTVYMGLCKAEVYRSLKFDEEMVRNQDDELSYRLLDRGGTIVLNPAIKSVYYGRATWSGIARQYREYGFWKIKVMRKHPQQARARHFAPAALVGGLALTGAAGVLGSGLGRFLFAAGLASYVIANLVSTIRATRAEPALASGVSAAYLTIHFSYGIGFLIGLGSELMGSIASLPESQSMQGEQRDP